VGRETGRRCPATSPPRLLRRRRGSVGHARRSRSAPNVASSVEEPTALLGASDDEQHLRVAPTPPASCRQTRGGRRAHPRTAPRVAGGRHGAGARGPGRTRGGPYLPRRVRARLLRAEAARGSVRLGDLLGFSCQRRAHGHSPPEAVRSPGPGPPEERSSRSADLSVARPPDRSAHAEHIEDSPILRHHHRPPTRAWAGTACLCASRVTGAGGRLLTGRGAAEQPWTRAPTSSRMRARVGDRWDARSVSGGASSAPSPSAGGGRSAVP
jgi:hypothetical protein